MKMSSTKNNIEQQSTQEVHAGQQPLYSNQSIN